jgi:hypothetical protein
MAVLEIGGSRRASRHSRRGPSHRGTSRRVTRGASVAARHSRRVASVAALQSRCRARHDIARHWRKILVLTLWNQSSTIFRQCGEHDGPSSQSCLGIIWPFNPCSSQIRSSVGFEECAHKLSKLQIPDGHEMELCNMLIECCSQERTYLRYGDL